ncbi:MAG: hypothetical protein JXQ90_20160 [Cyclobacteriaceae bacterium]
MVKVLPDVLNREYKILLSSPLPINVQVKLIGPGNEVLLDEEYVEKAFLKKYNLGEAARLGEYKFEINYDGEFLEYPFVVASTKRLLKESITASVDDLLNLKIHIKDYNKDPASIFLFGMGDKQLDYVFWEPTIEVREKVINLSKYDAYEIRLDILQKGDVVFSETFSMY